MDRQISEALEEMYLCNKPLVLIFWLASKRQDTSIRNQLLDWKQNESNREALENAWLTNIS